MTGESLRNLLTPEQLAQLDAVRGQLLGDPASLDKQSTTEPENVDAEA